MAKVHDYPTLKERLGGWVDSEAEEFATPNLLAEWSLRLGIAWAEWWERVGRKRWIKQEGEAGRLCHHCGKETKGIYHTLDVECGPTPDCPEGYGSQMIVCNDCYQLYLEQIPQEPLIPELVFGCDDIPF